MRKLAGIIVQPSIIALGASIFLYAYNDRLRVVDYFLHVPFWIGVVRPTGLYWNQKFLKQINKGTFPAEMKVYREMYLVSKNAILYDVVLNHTLYHLLLTPALLCYMYLLNFYFVNTSKLDNRKDTVLENKQMQSLTSTLKDSFLKLVKGRVLVSCASILSEYWISHIGLKQQAKRTTSSTYALPTSVKRFLLVKEMLLSWSWSGLILEEFYRNSWISTKSIGTRQQTTGNEESL